MMQDNTYLTLTQKKIRQKCLIYFLKRIKKRMYNYGTTPLFAEAAGCKWLSLLPHVFQQMAW
jgi:hypothetical protein